MSKIVLTSDGIDSQEILNFFKQNVNSKTKVAIITTAKDEKENANGPQQHKKIFLNLGVVSVDFFDLECDSPVSKLLNFDIIFLEGGNPFRLMHWIRKSKSENVFRKLFSQNKIIAGRSAGSMMLGKDFSICNYLSPEMNTMNITNFAGLGLCNINICPHYNEFPKIYENCEEKLKICEKDRNIKITKLLDGQAIVISNGNIEHLKGKVAKFET